MGTLGRRDVLNRCSNVMNCSEEEGRIDGGEGKRHILYYKKWEVSREEKREERKVAKLERP